MFHIYVFLAKLVKNSVHCTSFYVHFMCILFDGGNLCAKNVHCQYYYVKSLFCYS